GRNACVLIIIRLIIHGRIQCIFHGHIQCVPEYVRELSFIKTGRTQCVPTELPGKYRNLFCKKKSNLRKISKITVEIL
ncbi:MAG: hypothetical protein J5588_03085, partial [Bacteroidales bacterium]|nr:hypothetical protein [Bacteroidales bacterium]